MTNATMFVYAMGIVLKEGTSNAWDEVHELSEKDKHVKKWLESPYVQIASQDSELVKQLGVNGL